MTQCLIINIWKIKSQNKRVTKNSKNVDNGYNEIPKEEFEKVNTKKREITILIVDELENSADKESDDDDNSCDEKNGIDHLPFLDDSHEPLHGSSLRFS